VLRLGTSEVDWKKFTLLLGEEFFALLDIRNDGVTSWFPASGAHLSKFVSVLEGLDQTQGLIHRAANRQVIDGDLPQDALVINHKQTPVCNAFILLEHTIISGDGLSEICHQGNVHGTQATLFPWCVDPGQVREVRVCGCGNDLTANLTEFRGPLAESHNLSGAHEGEVQGVEEEDHIFPFEVGGRLADLSVSSRHGGVKCVFCG